jgi:hypothetical protein
MKARLARLVASFARSFAITDAAALATLSQTGLLPEIDQPDELSGYCATGIRRLEQYLADRPLPRPGE